MVVIKKKLWGRLGVFSTCRSMREGGLIDRLLYMGPAMELCITLSGC